MLGPEPMAVSRSLRDDSAPGNQQLRDLRFFMTVKDVASAHIVE